MAKHPNPYPLTEPVIRKRRIAGGDEITEETITEVKVRRAKGRDMRIMDNHKGKTAGVLAMISILTGLTQKEVDDLDAFDITNLGEMVSDFLETAPETGPTS